MSRSVAIVGASVAYVFRADVGGERRVLRTLLRHPDLGNDNLLLPLRQDDMRIEGLVLDATEATSDAWLALDLPVRWPKGRVPVAWTDDRERPLAFWTPDELASERAKELADVVTAGFDDTAPLIDRVARLEALDGLLDSHPVAVAALLALSEQHEGAPELGPIDLLRRRLLDAAPDGVQAVQRELNRTAFTGLRNSRHADSILGAATRAAAPNGVLGEYAWTRCRDLTLWSWWVQWKAGEYNLSVRGLADQLGVAPSRLASVAKGQHTPAELDLVEGLPDEAEVRLDLASSFAQQGLLPRRTRAAVQAHQGRLGLFAAQLAELQRALGDDRLTRWSEIRGAVREVAEALRLRMFAHRWQAGEFAAEMLRTLVSGPWFHDRDAGEVVGRMGMQLAGAVLPFAGQAGAWWSAPSTGGILFLTPETLGSSTGALRFAITHQLGHLIEGSGATCAAWADEEHSDDAHEAFANAFAAYALAPRREVIALTGRPGEVTADWLQNAARDLALTFGMSPTAALHHQLNCLGERAHPWRNRLRAEQSWKHWSRTVIERLGDERHGEAQALRDACGHLDDNSLERALSRPSAPAFDQALRRAVSLGQVPQVLEERYRA